MTTLQRHYRLPGVRLLAAVLVLLTVAAAARAESNEVTVYQAGKDGYHTYRIPAIVRAASGELLAFAEGRKNGPGDHGDIDIVLKRSSDNGRTWGPMQLVQDASDAPTSKVWIGNPTPIVDTMDPLHPGRIWLVFTRSNQSMLFSSSDDNGETWSAPRDITSTAGSKDWEWYAAGPVHGIQLTRGSHAGRLIAPCDHRPDVNGGWGSHLVYSDDHGDTWKLGAADTRAANDPIHPNECVAVELTDGRIYVNAREHLGSDPATRCIAFSSDGGQTFDKPFTAEPNIVSPVVQNSAIRFSAQDQGDAANLLVYAGAGDPKQRRDLTILTSGDEGRTWEKAMVLHKGPAAYCDLVKLDAERLGVLFEAGDKLYSEILFAVIPASELDSAK
jgi:sialidase-1